MKNAGADLSILLRGNAVNYIVNQECPPLEIGNAAIRHPAQPIDDINKLREKGVDVYVVQEDVEERGIDAGSCIGNIQMIRRRDVAGVFDQHDQVWHW